MHVDELASDLTLDGATFEASGAHDLLVSKLDPNGELLWSAQLGGDGNDVPWGLHTDRDDAVWVGTSESSDELTRGSISITKLAP